MQEALPSTHPQSPYSTFASLPSANTNHLEILSTQSEIREFAPRSLICEEGSADRCLFLLLEGRARVFTRGKAGRELVYANVSAPNHFGEMALDGGERCASVQALERCRCAVVEPEFLQNYLMQNPEFMRQMLMSVIGRARAATQAAQHMALDDVYTRLVRTLKQLSTEPATIPGYLAVTPKPTHQELGSLVGASREMISRLMKDMEKGGYVRIFNDSLAVANVLPTRW